MRRVLESSPAASPDTLTEYRYSAGRGREEVKAALPYGVPTGKKSQPLLERVRVLSHRLTITLAWLFFLSQMRLQTKCA
jgi:hypothetical protein